MPSDAPRIVIVSYQPNSTAKELLKVCIDSIQKYTPEPHELWVVDNCSPKENTKWLLDYPDLNVILNHNKYVKDGSYDNGIALELAKNVIYPKSKYLMTLHMDTMVCKEGWLTYILSKFTKDIKAVGVRMDKTRTPEGVLHILGATFDFRLIRELKLSFMPQLPNYDVGDLVTIGIRKEGYKVFACENTFVTPEIIQNISPNSPFRNFYFDRAIDDKGDIFFLHLGRGIVKSTGECKDKGKTLPEQWINLAKNVVLAESYNPNRSSYEKISPLFSRLDYSLRRYYVDEFFERKIRTLPQSATVLDIGGKKVRKRGQFDIEKHQVKVKYANIDPTTNPDYLCDGSKIPVESNSFDVVICSEVLEHVREPILILKEAFRVLKHGGIILICVPFLYKIHADPFDYSRFTDYHWQIILKEIGYKEIRIEKQGVFFSVIIDMLKNYALELNRKKMFRSRLVSGIVRSRLISSIVRIFVAYGGKKALDLEREEYYRNHSFYNSFTTGFGISGIK